MTGAEFQSRRLRLGLSISELADALQCNERTVRRWEFGSLPIPIYVTNRLLPLLTAIMSDYRFAELRETMGVPNRLYSIEKQSC